MFDIEKGHNSSSYFWIMPVKIIDISGDTNNLDNVVEYRECEISIEEDTVYGLLFYYINQVFDQGMEENKNRRETEVEKYYNDVSTTFTWNLTYNYFTIESINLMIDLIKKDIEKIKVDIFDSSLEEQRYYWNHAIDKEKLARYTNGIISFYEEFIGYMEEMIAYSKEKGYHLISFMGP